MHHSPTTLFQIMSKAQSQSRPDLEFMATTIACVVDITQPIFREKEQNYIVEAKLIDETFNPLTQTDFLFKYLTVHLISSNLNEVRLNSKIGDLILLNKFMFSTWNNVKLRTKFYGTFQSLSEVDSGQLQEDQKWSLKRKIGKETSQVNIQELSLRIAQLKSWLQLTFTKVFKPFIGVKIVSNYCALIEPFSMVLKASKIRKNEFENFLFLQDENKNHFYLDLKPFSYLLIKEDDWIYLRGIKQINLDKQIVFSETGRIIGLPMLFSEEYETQANYKAIYRKTNRLAQFKKESSSLTQVVFFESKLSTVKVLFDLQDQYESTSRKEDIMLQNNYLIKGAVVKYSGKLKLYHSEYQMIIDEKYLEEMPAQQKKSTIDEKKLSYVYEGQIDVMDQSILYKKQCLKVMVFTDDPKTTFFDEKDLEELSKFIAHSNIEKKKENCLQNIHEKLEKLKQLSTFENPASFVLEPIRSDRLIFRLINTKVL